MKKDSITNEDMLATLQSTNRNLADKVTRVKVIIEQVEVVKGVAGKLINDSQWQVTCNRQFTILNYNSV